MNFDPSGGTDWPSICSHFRILFKAKKYRRLLIFFVLIVGAILLIAAVAGISYFESQHNNILHHYVAREDDVAILSATYYNRSKSFENNTVVILFNAHQVLHYKHSEFMALATNDSMAMKTTFRIYPVIQQLPFYCKWVPFIAVGQVNENVRSLELSTGGPKIQLSLRVPYTQKTGVVACFSPLFLNERWQLLLLTAEVYSHYGAFMHFYVRSMISDLFKILESYKRARIVPWGAVQLGGDRANTHDFDPNIELEFRNQAGAMTDCLLMYKESAQFIIFPDSDDIIVPRLGPDYLSEFTRVFDMYPDAAAVAYNMSQTSITTATAPSNYSVTSVLTSIRFRGETRWGKLVVKPERTDSTWIHRSYGIREGYEQVSLPVHINSILHLRFWNFTNSEMWPSLKSPSYNPLLSNDTHAPLIETNDLRKIHSSFIHKTLEMSRYYDRLPQYSLYYPLIERCYDKIFYNGQQHNTCKGPELCDLPSFPGVRCTNVQTNYSTSTGYTNLFFHRQTSNQFVHGNNGCKV